MKKELIITKDGSHTILLPHLNVTYHSNNGAIQESNHVYIQAGLDFVAEIKQTPIRIFEMGFGTGLNALLTCLWVEEHSIPVQYTAIELNPLTTEEGLALNYPSLLDDIHQYSHKIQAAEWEVEHSISSYFQLTKQQISLLDYEPSTKFNLIYFDAFDPNTQPALWTTDVFIKLFNMLGDNGVLVTYSSKSDVRRSMVAAGFTVEKLQGPPGKREMVRAVKTQ